MSCFRVLIFVCPLCGLHSAFSICLCFWWVVVWFGFARFVDMSVLMFFRCFLVVVFFNVCSVFFRFVSFSVCCFFLCFCLSRVLGLRRSVPKSGNQYQNDLVLTASEARGLFSYHYQCYLCGIDRHHRPQSPKEATCKWQARHRVAGTINRNRPSQLYNYERNGKLPRECDQAGESSCISVRPLVLRTFQDTSHNLTDFLCVGPA